MQNFEFRESVWKPLRHTNVISWEGWKTEACGKERERGDKKEKISNFQIIEVQECLEVPLLV